MAGKYLSRGYELQQQSIAITEATVTTAMIYKTVVIERTSILTMVNCLKPETACSYITVQFFYSHRVAIIAEIENNKKLFFNVYYIITCRVIRNNIIPVHWTDSVR